MHSLHSPFITHTVWWFRYSFLWWTGFKCNLCNCQKINRVTRVKYLFRCNYRLEFSVEIRIINSVMRLRSLTFKLFKLNEFLLTEILYTVYNALYDSIFQYRLLLRGGCSDNAIKPLEIQQKKYETRICLNKKQFHGSTSLNYKELGVLSVRYL